MSERKILITDDRAGIRSLLKEVLQESGYEVLTAAGGQEGIKIVQENTIDIVLLDMKMPGMDGLETLRLIKKAQPNVKVIIMTAYEDMEIIKEVQKRGASCYISKPFDIEELLSTIKRLLKKSAEAAFN